MQPVKAPETKCDMKISEVLTNAKALIVDPEKWYKGNYHKDDDASCMCSLGAINAVVTGNPLGEPDFPNWHESMNHVAYFLRSVVLLGSEHDTFAVYNDNRTHAEVMEAFDKAIAKAKEQNV